MRRALSLAALILLAGCTNDIAVTASLDNGQVVFAAPPDQRCWDRAMLRNGKGNVVWEIGDPANGSRPCAAANPLRYGGAPAGVPTMRPAQPLVAGESYALIAGPGPLRAAFRYNGPTAAPTNYRPQSAEWCAVQYRGSTPDWFGQCAVK